MLIFIVEDEKILAKFLKEDLENEGFEVDVAYDGEEAIERLKSGPQPDMILLDLILPKKDGFEVLEEIKKGGFTRGVIPVIVLSNLGGDGDIKKALDLGAVDYFVKAQHPIAEVVEKVHNFIEAGFVPPKKVRRTKIIEKIAHPVKVKSSTKK